MADARRLERLRGLTALVYDRDRQALATLAARLQALEAERLRWQEEAARSADPEAPMAAAAYWSGHARLGQARAASARDALQPDVEAARNDLAKSFGRREALEQVIARTDRRK